MTSEREFEHLGAADFRGGPRESEGRLALLPIDPHRVHVYWEIPAAAVALARRELGDSRAPLVIRFYPRSTITWHEALRELSFDIDVDSTRGSQYVNLWTGGLALSSELGVRSRAGEFARVLRSNRIELPREDESEIYEDRRMRVLGSGEPLWKPRLLAVPGEEARGAARSAPELEASPVAWEGNEDSSPEEARLPPSSAAVEAAPAGRGEGQREPGDAPGEEAATRGPIEDASGQLAGEGGLSPGEEEATRGAIAGPEERPTSTERTEDPGPKTWQARAKEAPSGVGDLSSWDLSSWGLSVSEAAGREPVEARSELVIRGRAPPGGDVVVVAAVVTPRADGCFELRLSVPAGSTVELVNVRDASSASPRRPET